MANKQTYEFNKSIKDLNITDLKAKIQEDQLRLKKLEFAHAISPLENPMNIRGLRRDVARLQTELKKKALSFASEWIKSRLVTHVCANKSVFYSSGFGGFSCSLRVGRN